MNTYEEQQETNTPITLSDELSQDKQIDIVAREILETYHLAFEELAK